MPASTGDDLRELGVTAGPKEENNMLLWEGNIRGPAPYYSGGNFRIEITFTSDYPFKAPQVRLPVSLELSSVPLTISQCSSGDPGCIPGTSTE